jgi:hypothetical protein
MTTRRPQGVADDTPSEDPWPRPRCNDSLFDGPRGSIKAELGTARDIAEPILEWADLVGIDSLGLSRRYREWKKGVDQGGSTSQERR